MIPARLAATRTSAIFANVASYRSYDGYYFYDDAEIGLKGPCPAKSYLEPRVPAEGGEKCACGSARLFSCKRESARECSVSLAESDLERVLH